MNNEDEGYESSNEIEPLYNILAENTPPATSDATQIYSLIFKVFILESITLLIFIILQHSILHLVTQHHHASS